MCTKVLAEKNEFVRIIFNVECRKAVANMLEESKLMVEYGTGKRLGVFACGRVFDFDESKNPYLGLG